MGKRSLQCLWQMGLLALPVLVLGNFWKPLEIPDLKLIDSVPNETALCSVKIMSGYISVS